MAWISIPSSRLPAILSILTLISLLPSSQSQLTLPSCANICLIDYARNTTCVISDFKCLCSDQRLIDNIAPCIEADCSSDDIISIVRDTASVCSSYGITLSLPLITTFSAPATTPPSTTATSDSTTPDITSTNSITSSTSTPSTTSSPPSTASSSAKPPIGAIVGGSIGGLAALLVGGWAILHEMNRRAKLKQELIGLQNGIVTSGPQPIWDGAGAYDSSRGGNRGEYANPAFAGLNL